MWRCEQAWALADQGKTRVQIARIMGTTLRNISNLLQGQRKRLGLAHLPPAQRSAPIRKKPLGNIYWPEAQF